MTRTVLLAIDTSIEFCSIALLDSIGHTSGDYTSGHLQIWVRQEATGALSSMWLLPAVRELFNEVGFALTDCDAIAFGAGPGSFTGLRTATGVAQGLAFGLNLPVVPVGTLLTCAEAARINDSSVTRVIAALDAKMDEVYWADYAWSEERHEWRTVYSASLDVPGQVAIPDVPFTLAGNAAIAFGERLPVATHARYVDTKALPHAQAVAMVALRGLYAGCARRAAEAVPEYVRNKIAQTVAERFAAKSAPKIPLSQ